MNKYNTFWPRFAALIIDGIVIYMLGLPFKWAGPVEDSTLKWLFWLVETNLPYAYAIWMIGAYGQTLGKRFMDIKVVDNLTEEKIGYHQSFMRESVPFILVNLSAVMWLIIGWDFDPELDSLTIFSQVLIAIPSSMLSIWAILELITTALDEKNRALHDKIADTVVVRV